MKGRNVEKSDIPDILKTFHSTKGMNTDKYAAVARKFGIAISTASKHVRYNIGAPVENRLRITLEEKELIRADFNSMSGDKASKIKALVAKHDRSITSITRIVRTNENKFFDYKQPMF